MLRRLCVLPLLLIGPPSPPAAVEAPGLHNVYRITPALLSGSSPEGDAGFRSLHRLGVRTIITVDGARPDIARARRFGMRYVHLPFGYDGPSREQIWRLAKAVRDLPGPVYLHCHHGMHRGPAAAAGVHLCLDKDCRVETALAEMRRAGTDPHYVGLYGAVRTLRRPRPQDLDRLPADFPAVAKVPALAEMMVSLDQRWDNLKQVRAAGWQAPAEHPDLDPPHEALQVAELYREMARLEAVRTRPAEFRKQLAEAETEATELVAVLRQRDAARAAKEKAFAAAARSCTRCHAAYRDVPRGP